MTYDKKTKQELDTLKSRYHSWAKGFPTKRGHTEYHPYTRKGFFSNKD